MIKCWLTKMAYVLFVAGLPLERFIVLTIPISLAEFAVYFVINVIVVLECFKKVWLT